MTEAAFLERLADLLPTRPPLRSITGYVEGRRLMPAGTPFPGPWRTARTPYLREIMEDLSPSSPVQHEVLMFAAQTGKTACAENVVGFFMDPCPCEILFVTSTEELAETWSTRRLDPLIDSLGFRHKIAAQTENRKSRRSGDKVFSKQFPGGSLRIVSAQAAASLRAASVRLLIRDEIDGAPAELRTGEGNWLDVSEARANAWGARKKILDVSTPTTVEASEINRLYELGDCRKYLVPCPHCGKVEAVGLSLPGSPTLELCREHGFQELVLGSDSGQHGLRGEFKAGRLVRAVYVCEHCREAILEHHKPALLARGRWVATKPSYSSAYVSRQLSSLYSPVGMLSWSDLFQKYLLAREEPDGLRSFQNLYLGLPFKETGARPELRAVIALRGTYRRGRIPGHLVGGIWAGPLYLVAGVDVQRGKAKDDELGPRLELEILGIGSGYRTWSIDTVTFNGAVDDPFSGAWEAMNEWAAAGGLAFPEVEVGGPHGPQPMPVSMIFIDSGDNTDIVYRFCRRWQSTLPSKGLSVVIPDKKKREQGDIPGSAFKKYRLANVGGDQVLIEINTRFYKRLLYGNLKIPRSVTDPQPPGFCDFPLDYDEEYFAQLTAEEQLADGSFRKVRGRNEALDCRVMALCAGDLWLDGQVRDFQAAARQQGAAPWQLTQINGRWVLERLAARIRPRAGGE